MNNLDSKEYNALALLANLCQIANFDMNIKEISNDEIMKHLEKQDLILDEQINEYLAIIVEQNKYIISLLEKIQNKII